MLRTAGWQLLFSPCGMLACVTPRGAPHSPKGSLVIHVRNICTKRTFLAHRYFCSSTCASFLVLSVAGHAGGPRQHWVQVRAWAEVRGTCSGDSKSRKLVNNHGIAF